MPIYDFYCEGLDCSLSMEPIELLMKVDEEVRCVICQRFMIKKVSAPKGYVKGTETPCRQ
jgi:hypothetical protein